jgi:quercetin dioxygenase-like cupin family protein
LEYLRKVDLAALEASGKRVAQVLLDRDSGATSCSVTCTKTPSGEGSPAGLHTHVVDQMFYILSGTMNLEIAGQAYTAGPGTLIVLPAGVPHRNWNGGIETTVHLAFNSPLPAPDEPFSRPVAVNA